MLVRVLLRFACCGGYGCPDGDRSHSTWRLQHPAGRPAPRAPRIASASVEDTDNADEVWSAGDFITLTFDMPTDRAAARGDKAFVDRLFRIQPPIGADYSGEWQTDRLFRIQALDTVGGDLLMCNHDGCGAHQTSNATLSGTLRNRGSTSRPSVTRAALMGISDSGPPLLERFEVRVG